MKQRNKWLVLTIFSSLSAWVPEVNRAEIENILSKYEGLLVVFNDENEMLNRKIPTKLKNNKIFKPFETLVRMYGMYLTTN